jgi:hypothetical protein
MTSRTFGAAGTVIADVPSIGPARHIAADAT